jgi:hypothetical protein
MNFLNHYKKLPREKQLYLKYHCDIKSGTWDGCFYGNKGIGWATACKFKAADMGFTDEMISDFNADKMRLRAKLKRQAR